MELHAFGSADWIVTIGFTPAFDLRPATSRWGAGSPLPGPAGALYALIDEVTDAYLEVVEKLEDAADDLEDKCSGAARWATTSRRSRLASCVFAGTS